MGQLSWRGFRVAAIGGVGVLAAFGIAACGSGSSGSKPGSAPSAAAGPASAAQALDTAYRSTTGQKTVAFRIDEVINVPGAGGSSGNMAITGAGQADLASHALSVSINAPGGGSVKIVQSRGIEYIQVPPSQRNSVPGHKPWMSLNLNKVAQAKLGIASSQLAAPNTSDPAQALTQLASVSSSVSKAGAATVAGVSTTEYKAQISLDKLASQMQAKYGPMAAQAIRQEEQKLGASLPVEVWVDAQHLARQIRYQIPVPATGGGVGAGTATATMTFTSFGVPVTITPPPHTQVGDVTSQVLQKAKAGSG